MSKYKPAVLGGAEVQGVTVQLESPEAKSALHAFLELGLADRAQATRHVWAYYQDVRALIGADELDAYMAVPTSPEDIWAHVLPTALSVIDDEIDWYVMIECNCDWEPEHGLEMSWRHGTQIAKVGPFNSHPTNAWAYDDDRLTGVVYKSQAGANTHEAE